ncbi:MAG: hypothetical protein IPH07_30390 [Deltaproteobacteria bacterium]|nr:hypothetical protein [Deltaproteobacteria bacterium]MBK8715224.1 hypothetical protein [Deltaproteobacteria bacterium]
MPKMRVLDALGFVSISLAVGACEGSDELPVEHTEHLDVYPSDEDRVCAGTLDDMEASIAAFTDFLGVELESRITVYYGGGAVEEHCPATASGCAWPVDAHAAVATLPQSVDHELVHGVRYATGIRGRRFFEEGIAVYVSAIFSRGYEVGGTPTGADARGPLQLYDLPSNEITADDYPTAASFTRWMFETSGDAQALGFLEDPRYADASDVDGAFIDHLGQPIADADAQWRSSGDDIDTFGERCSGAIERPWSADGFVFEGVLDCADHDTLGPVNGSMSHRTLCIEIPAAITLDVALEGAAGDVYLGSDGCAASQGLGAEAYQDKHVDAAMLERHEFAACRWIVVVNGEPDGRGGAFTLRMTP